MIKPKEDRIVDFNPPDNLVVSRNDIVKGCNAILLFLQKNGEKNIDEIGQYLEKEKNFSNDYCCYFLQYLFDRSQLNIDLSSKKLALPFEWFR